MVNETKNTGFSNKKHAYVWSGKAVPFRKRNSVVMNSLRLKITFPSVAVIGKCYQFLQAFLTPKSELCFSVKTDKNFLF